MDDIDRQLQDILNTYAGNVRDEVNKEVVKAANQLKKAISADAPKKSGKQKRSWKVSTSKRAGIDTVAVVHSTDYQKVHLLENGHLTRDGVTRSKAFHYVSKNEEEVLNKFASQVANAVKAVGV